MTESKKSIKKEFFDELAGELDKLFPKGKCKERGQALVFNALANVLFFKKIERIIRDYKRFEKKTKIFIMSEVIGKDEEILSKDVNSVNWRNARNNLRYEQRRKLKKGIKK